MLRNKSPEFEKNNVGPSRSPSQVAPAPLQFFHTLQLQVGTRAKATVATLEYLEYHSRIHPQEAQSLGQRSG